MYCIASWTRPLDSPRQEQWLLTLTPMCSLHSRLLWAACILACLVLPPELQSSWLHSDPLALAHWASQSGSAGSQCLLVRLVSRDKYTSIYVFMLLKMEGSYPKLPLHCGTWYMTMMHKTIFWFSPLGDIITYSSIELTLFFFLLRCDCDLRCEQHEAEALFCSLFHSQLWGQGLAWARYSTNTFLNGKIDIPRLERDKKWVISHLFFFTMINKITQYHFHHFICILQKHEIHTAQCCICHCCTLPFL